MGLEKARKRRARRAAALEELRCGQLALRKVLTDGHRSLGTCPIWALLMAAPGLGWSSVRSTLERSHVYALLPLQELSDIQREAILNELPRRIK